MMLKIERLIRAFLTLVLITSFATIVVQGAQFDYEKQNCYGTADCKGTSNIGLLGNNKVFGDHDGWTSPYSPAVYVTISGQLWKEGGIVDTCSEAAPGNADCRTDKSYTSADDGTIWKATSNHFFEAPFETFAESTLMGSNLGNP